MKEGWVRGGGRRREQAANKGGDTRWFATASVVVSEREAEAVPEATAGAEAVPVAVAELAASSQIF